MAQETEEMIDLKVWNVWQFEHAMGIRAAMREFDRRHPNINVKMSPSIVDPRGVMSDQKFMCAVAGQVPPDVMNQDRFAIGQWAARGAFMSLNSFFEEEAKKEDGLPLETFYPDFIEEGSYQGQVYGVPWNTDARMLLYNREILRNAGYVNEQGEVVPPANWDELVEYALDMTVTDENGNLERAGFLPLFGNSWLYLYGWQNGGRFMSEDGLTCTLNDPKIVEALEWVTNLTDQLGGQKKIDVFGSSFQSGANDPFLIGKVAMMITENSYLGLIARYGPDLNFGVSFPPVAYPGAPKVTWSGGFSYVIPQDAAHPQEAWEFVKWMVCEEGVMFLNRVQQRYNASRGQPFLPWISASPEMNEMIYDEFIVKNPDLNRNMKLAFREFIDALPHSKFRPVTPVGLKLWEEHYRATEKAIRHDGGITPKEALDQGTVIVQEQLDRLFKRAPLPLLKWRYPILIFIALALLGVAFIYVRFRHDITWRAIKHPENVAGYTFAFPWFFGFMLLTIGPILASVVFSFCEYDVMHAPRFYGLNNFRILFSEKTFWLSLWNTLFMILGLPLGIIVSLALAMLLNTAVRGMTLYRTIFYLPAIVPAVAASILWIWVLNPSTGLLNSMLRIIGIEGPVWLSDVNWSKPSIILMMLWGSGASMIIWLAGLKNIPGHLYEAARMDGAGWWSQQRHVTIPMLSPYIFFNLLMGIINTFQIFAQAFIMTRGGPLDSTLFYVYHLFNKAFVHFQVGQASAMAWILFVIILVLTVIQLRLSKKWVYYEGMRE